MAAKTDKTRADKIQELLTRGVEDIIDRVHLEKALRGDKKLRVKLGIDPTAPDLHLGHAVVLWKLREFQELGHKAVLIIGDFTAMIGDPSGRSAERPALSAADVRRNMKRYLEQAGQIIDVRKAEVRHNSEWLNKLGGAAMLHLLSQISVQQILEREDFAKRLSEHHPIRGNEILYPVMQAYDSVAVKADVELGGNDQLLNLLTGRQLMPRMGLEAQDILTVQLLVGLDGSKKMSKSVGNTINILDAPGEMYGKIMSMRDEAMSQYFRLATDLSEENIDAQERALKKGANPKGAKEFLALEIVQRYHGAQAARAAQKNFGKMFAEKDLATAAIPELKAKKSMTTLDLVLASKMASSRSDARRLIDQGAVSVDGDVKKDPKETLSLKAGSVVKVGKKSFFRIKL
jgi:tyrosyl-tRNA synthetase